MSEVKLRDVLHLYIGCECEFVEKIERVDGRIADLFRNGYVALKPILRPLEDMTEEEAKEIGKKLESGFWSIWHDAVLHGEGWDNTNFSALEYVELLARGFDLFNLISSGQAISKNDKG